MLPKDCKYPLYIEDVNTCLTTVEAAYVYSQIESDKIIFPVADSNSATPANFFSMIGEFTTMYEIPEVNDEVQAPLPFANCDSQELDTFFGHAEVTPEKMDYLVDLAYGPNTRTTEIATQPDDDWSILTPFPRYPTPTLDPKLQTGLFYHNNAREKSATRIAPIATTHPSDSYIRRIYFEKFDKVNPQLIAASKFSDLSDVSTMYLGSSSQHRQEPFVLEGQFPMDSSATVFGVLPDNQAVECLIDTGAIRSIMTRAYFEACPSLSKLPRLKSIHKYCLIGNGQ